MDEVAEKKARDRSMWTAGDYASLNDFLRPVGADIVSRAHVRRGDTVLDIACGTGNAAIQAASTGAEVTGLDLTPALLERAAEDAKAASVEVEWVEGDAEALPFEDSSFDVVLSTLGVMFAPRHDVAAAELARVLRSGGRVALANWTPEGAVGDFFRIVGKHVPPLPSFASSPLLWGTEDHLSLFSGAGIDWEFERNTVKFTFESAPEALAFWSERFGPIVTAKAALLPQGKWQTLADDLGSFYESHAETPGGEVLYLAEYLAVTGRKAE